MARANDDIEQTLLEFADLLSILTTDPYKPRSYEKAARSVGGYHADVSTLDMKGILQIPNVGKSIGEKIVELLAGRDVRRPGGAACPDPARGSRADVDPGLGSEEGDGAVPGAGDRIRPRAGGGDRGRTRRRPQGVRRQDRRRTSSAGSQQLSDSGGRVLVNAALDVAESLLAELDGMKQVASVGVRRIAAADARDDRRRRPAGRERQRRADHGRVRRAALGIER